MAVRSSLDWTERTIFRFLRYCDMASSLSDLFVAYCVAFFGGWAYKEKRIIFSITSVRCLRVPRFWLASRPSNIWFCFPVSRGNFVKAVLARNGKQWFFEVADFSVTDIVLSFLSLESWAARVIFKSISWKHFLCEREWVKWEWGKRGCIYICHIHQSSLVSEHSLLGAIASTQKHNSIQFELSRCRMFFFQTSPRKRGICNRAMKAPHSTSIGKTGTLALDGTVKFNPPDQFHRGEKIVSSPA